MTIHDDMKSSIESSIDGAVADVGQGNGPGHFVISVTSAAFEGKSLLQKQRLVLNAIKHLMSGPDAPVHAVDKITTSIP